MATYGILHNYFTQFKVTGKPEDLYVVAKINFACTMFVPSFLSNVFDFFQINS